jgi:polypeptide N-acetylgalactosaminyltransferase
MLARTLHSIYNRTPHFLVREIILVNDNSTLPELNENLKEYTQKHFGDLVKHYVLRERMGLINARMEGARIAKGQVLVGRFIFYFSPSPITLRKYTYEL